MAHAIDPSGPGKRYRIWLVAAGWVTAALTEAVALDASEAVPFESGFPASVLSHAVLGILVWQVWRAHAHLELWKRRPLHAVSVHAAVGVGALAIWGAAEATFMRLRYGENFWQLVYADSWALQLLSTVPLYAAAVGLGVIVESFDREQRRRQREAELELLARDAELTAIKSQLQPHFLLNSLNSILALVEHDSTKARAMLERLASLLQSVFDRLDEPLVLLHSELDTIRDYLKIEQVRFADRLRFTIEAHGATEQVTVPPFLLQPLVENAVKHGIQPYTRQGEVRVTARRQGARVHVAVSDTGSGPNASHGTSGRGIDLTRRRLRATYGDNGALLSMTHEESGGFTVGLDLPTDPELAGGFSSPGTHAS
ncbi:MAG: histidine kinase [Gammaproteobacteria bacterium]|nr:histidine kinase [Gammaproteobacteria bacterium]